MKTIHTYLHTYPCCVLPQVAAFVLNSVGVSELLKEFHLFNDVLPFLQGDGHSRIEGENMTKADIAGLYSVAKYNGTESVKYDTILVYSAIRRKDALKYYKLGAAASILHSYSKVISGDAPKSLFLAETENRK